MDRSFLFGAVVSLLWHLFWFFAVTIVVTPQTAERQSPTKLVSLGPVLDDMLIKTLVESRPEYSKAFYRELSDFEVATEVPAQTIERRESGEVTSLPLGGMAERRLRRLMSGDKAFPGDLFKGGGGFSVSDYFSLEGDVSAGRLLSRPEPPEVNDVRPVEIRFEIDSAGRVASSEIAVSSGDAALDARWQDHFRQWLFSPSPVLGEEGRLRGKVVFRRSTVS